MRDEEVRRENERYYYKHYIWSIRFRKWGPVLCVIVMACISLMIRSLFLKQLFFQQAKTILIPNDMDVMEWVNAQVEENWWDGMVFLIIGINLIMFIIILWTFYGIKSYNLYKYNWIIGIPIVLYFVEFVLMLFNYYMKTDFIAPIIALVFNLAPALVYSRLLYPLESRPPVKGEKSLDAIFEFFTKLVIDKL